MNVKTIFKTLIGTIVVMVLGALIVELMNISIASMQLKQLTKIAARDACILFTQETYKQHGGGGAISSDSIKDSYGGTYCSGNFYGSDDAEQIYKSLYVDNSWFLKFSDIEGSTPYPDLKKIHTVGLLHKAADSSYTPSTSFDWDSGDMDDARVAAYRENMYTPVNLGIPYLDIYDQRSDWNKSVVDKMYRWNLTQLLTNCNDALVQQDNLGNWCVNYKGFKCYTGDAYWDTCRLSSLEYMVFDMTDGGDRAKLNKVLNFDVGGTGNLSVDTSNNQEENKYITAVGIKYTIPVRYEGITPLRKIISYMWNRQNVQGMEATAPVSNRTGSGWNDNINSTVEEGGFKMGADSYATWADRATAGFYPASGKLVYTLVR